MLVGHVSIVLCDSHSSRHVSPHLLILFQLRIRRPRLHLRPQRAQRRDARLGAFLPHSCLCGLTLLLPLTLSQFAILLGTSASTCWSPFSTGQWPAIASASSLAAAQRARAPRALLRAPSWTERIPRRTLRVGPTPRRERKKCPAMTFSDFLGNQRARPGLTHHCVQGPALDLDEFSSKRDSASSLMSCSASSLALGLPFALVLEGLLKIRYEEFGALTTVVKA